MANLTNRLATLFAPVGREIVRLSPYWGLPPVAYLVISVIVTGGFSLGSLALVLLVGSLLALIVRRL